MVRSDLAVYLVAGVFLILWLLLPLGCTARTTPAVQTPPRRKRAPKPFAGLTRKPKCEACEQEDVSHLQMPGEPPPRMLLTRGRHCQVDTTGHFCPHTTCSYHGWVDWGNIRANGHPTGRHWRQLVCLGCRGYFLDALIGFQDRGL